MGTLRRKTAKQCVEGSQVQCEGAKQKQCKKRTYLELTGCLNSEAWT